MDTWRTLIDAGALRALLAANRPVALLDCGFDLTQPAAGLEAYRRGHVPGARYADLDRDLAGAKNGRNGRHPLPSREAFAATLGAWGILPATQVVTYDAQGGPYAARAWWMLRWMGHDAVAVLDGGLAAWRAAGGPIETGDAHARPAPDFPVRPPAMPTISADELLAALGQVALLDARAGERFRGEVETLDPVAGHIPGATLRFFKDNLQADGRFKPADVLRREFESLGAAAGAEVVHQCGSGVTACHNLLAMAHAGFDGGRLYAGSWSEWCADPARPVAVG